MGEAADGRKLSPQAWAILPKIRKVDTFLHTDLRLNQSVREVHPEVCFWAWNGSKAMAHGNKLSAGRTEREAPGKPLYGTDYTAAQSSLPRGQYGNDDLLDAFAALWTGERVVAGKELVIPVKPPVDSCGLRMEIVAWQRHARPGAAVDGPLAPSVENGVFSGATAKFVVGRREAVLPRATGLAFLLDRFFGSWVVDRILERRFPAEKYRIKPASSANVEQR